MADIPNGALAVSLIETKISDPDHEVRDVGRVSDALIKALTLAEVAVPVLREGGMVRHAGVEPKPTKPAIARLRWTSSQRRRSEQMPKQ
jgi:hypothetical protein